MADGLLSLIDDELLRRGLISSAALNDPQGASAEPGASMFPPLPDGPLDAKLMMAGLQLAILSQMIRGAFADAHILLPAELVAPVAPPRPSRIT